MFASLEAGEFFEIKPEKDLLNPITDRIDNVSNFNACLNAHGMYETMRFVLRLSPRVHELVNDLVESPEKSSPESLQAYSTYIHETVHWWQHVGSTSGLLYSLCYFGQTHGSLGELREVIEKFGANKPLMRWTNEILQREGVVAQAKLANANIAVNNALDVEYYKKYAFSPKRFAPLFTQDIFFESIGHSYTVAYGQLSGMISSIIDPDFKVLPNVNGWDENFARLTLNEHEGFFHDSPIRVPPVGLHAIYEGQARFIQLQFLSSVFKNASSCQEWRDKGFLDGVYVEAFEHFLRLSKSDWPESLDDPIVGLFLLVCDLAINPTRGFPFDIESFEDFILDVDVGIRFFKLSQSIVELPHLRGVIQSFSREEYIAVSAELTKKTGYDHPLAALEEIASWIDKSPELAALMSEQRTFEYNSFNLPIRVIFSHFISFSRDKFIRPEFFCWPGVWMVGNKDNAKIRELWLRHLSLFGDKGDSVGVYPRKWPDREELPVKKMFETFYTYILVYNLTNQWILNEGSFKFDYSWLSNSSYSQEEAYGWANDAFRQVYGVNLSDFNILKSGG